MAIVDKKLAPLSAKGMVTLFPADFIKKDKKLHLFLQMKLLASPSIPCPPHGKTR